MAKKKQKAIEVTALHDVISMFDSKTEAADEIGTTIQNINRWELRGTFPPKWALKIERLTDGKVTARQILEENEAIENGLI